MNTTKDEVLKAISIAKIQMARMPDTAFMFALCCQLETVVDSSINTGATNGLRIIYNPEFFMELTPDERIFLIAHETLHVAYLHMDRKNQRNHLLWNMATDYVINLQLVDAGFSFIKGGLLDKKYAGMNAEQVYDLLYDEMDLDNLPNNLLSDDLIMSDVDDNAITQNIISASMQAQQMNQAHTTPEAVRRFLDSLTEPKVDWRVVLQRFMVDTAKDDYSWRKPNRRMLTRGFYLPSLQSTSLSKISFAVDTSGSISQKEFNLFMSEVLGVLKQFKPKEIDIIQFHHEVTAHDTIKSLNDFTQIKLMGCGGTEPNTAIQAFMKTNSKALIVITDGFFNPSLINPNRPVIWVIYGNPNFTAPFGKIIHLE